MENEYFSTKNLYTAAYLLASGAVTFQGFKQLDYKTKLFLFSPLQKAIELEREYYSGGALPAKTLFAEYNTAKDMLFDKTNGDGRTSYYGETYK